MRHQVFGKRLSRDIKARKALSNNLANSLIISEAIITTTAKAKFARGYFEKIITMAKKNRLNDNRKLASLLTGDAFGKLTNQIAPGFAKRAGGYTRIVRLSPRRGDLAPMAKLELVEWQKQAIAKNLPAAKQKVNAKIASQRKKINPTKKTKKYLKKPTKNKR